MMESVRVRKHGEGIGSNLLPCSEEYRTDSAVRILDQASVPGQGLDRMRTDQIDCMSLASALAVSITSMIGVVTNHMTNSYTAAAADSSRLLLDQLANPDPLHAVRLVASGRQLPVKAYRVRRLSRIEIADREVIASTAVVRRRARPYRMPAGHSGPHLEVDVIDAD